LHVRTAFPTTGGFDEGTTLLCLHPQAASSRFFSQFLPEIAEDRSVYAPDLPGCGESDPAPQMSVATAVAALVDFAADLRLRHVDVLGLRFGAAVALELAVVKPDLVRRLVLVAPPPMPIVPALPHPSLVVRLNLGASDTAQWTERTMPKARFLDLADHSIDVFEASRGMMAKPLRDFLRATS